MSTPSADDLIKLFGLVPHPEGGYFRETYRAAGWIVRPDSRPKGVKGERNYSTAIYFLLPQGARSNLHRLAFDEIWHFYVGGPMTLFQIFPDGKITQTTLGHDLTAGQTVQHVVPGGCWFGGYPNPGVEYSFVGCTEAPGFEFADFEMGKRGELIKQFPMGREVIKRLTSG